MVYEFSIIVPVYNRQQEIKEFLESCCKVKDIKHTEIVIIEDGSSLKCDKLIEDFKSMLNLSYYFKPNTGPGDSRNYGMQKAKADYFLIFDSDVLLPENYLINLKDYLKDNYVDCFGGPDKAHKSFSNIQKGIDYAMTSFWTTGGIRGNKNQSKKFQPRSFNMGISKKAFLASAGFSNIHPGEDPDLSLRLVKLNFKTALFLNCYVFHKRRISWKGFSKQMFKFGLVRPILNLWHPQSIRLIFFMPSVFIIGFLLAIILLFNNFIWLMLLYLLYLTLVFIDAFKQTKSLSIALYVNFAVLVQFSSYGLAFLLSNLKIMIFNLKPEVAFPFLFFKIKK